MGLSVNAFTYTGNDEFDLNFALGYTSKGDVTAYKTGAPLVEITFDWLTDSRVRLGPGHGLSNGDEVVFRRTVSKNTLPVDLSSPGSVTRETIETLALHNLYALHEVLDSRVSDVSPWEIVGTTEGILNVVTHYDYLSTYEDARDV